MTPCIKVSTRLPSGLLQPKLYRKVVRLLVTISVSVGWLLKQGAAETNRVATEPQVKISVLSLFHTDEFRLEPAPGEDLTLSLNGQTYILNAHTAVLTIQAIAHSSIIEVGGLAEPNIHTDLLQSVPDQSKPGSFILEVPGKLRRRYTGSLTLKSRTFETAGTSRHILEAIVTMPLETAVASIVQAESPPQANLEALKAQAIASRSFLAARQTAHLGFDFCDTTHCQFLREPPIASSAAFQATQATQGIILVYHDSDSDSTLPLAAMYARSCSGHTRTLRDIGLPNTGYPYYRVQCRFCSQHPEMWRSAIYLNKEDVLNTEQHRLAFNRVHGWAALPSLPSTIAAFPANDLKGFHNSTGVGIGHGIGLCQMGAADMALHGANFAQILAHYYPNTQLSTLPPR